MSYEEFARELATMMLLIWLIWHLAEWLLPIPIEPE